MITIAWDVDDVLNDLTARWFEHWSAANPGCPATFASLRENPPHAILGIDKETYLRSLDQFREATATQPLAPRREVMNWFEHAGAAYRHVAISAVPLAYAPLSAAWVSLNFGRWIHSFNFVPSSRPATGVLPCHFTGKKDFLRWFGKIDILIEDNERNAADAKMLGIEAILFPRPWNYCRDTTLGNFFDRLELTLARLSITKDRHDD